MISVKTPYKIIVWSKELALIDPDLKEFLLSEFKHLSEKMDNIIGPIKEDIVRHRGDIDDLYNKDRETKERLQKTETNLENHLESHKEKKNDNQFNVGQALVIVALIATILADKFL